jgi:DNA uptake protein ComE-like DNA-binding protein
MLVALGVAIWLLWNICRNTNDALDKQTAIQYEIVALGKRMEELMEKITQVNDVKKIEAPTQSIDTPVALVSTNLVSTSLVKTNLVSTNLVSINTGTIKELMTLPKVGKGLGQKIIDTRPFGTLDELVKVPGVSADMLVNIKPLIRL